MLTTPALRTLVPTDDEQHTRAIIAALWPSLKAGVWGPRSTRDLDDFGNRPAHQSVSTGVVPRVHAEVNSVVTTRIRNGILAVTTEEPPHRVLLTEPDYQQALTLMTDLEFDAHQRSLSGERLSPYRWTTDRYGRAYLAARKEGWDASWSRHARAALDRVANAAVCWPATEGPPERVGAV